MKASSGMGPLRRQLLALAKEHVYQFRKEGFLLASGKRSQHYYNCKKLSLYPTRLKLVAEAMRDELIPEHGLPLPRAVGGMTLGADPIAYALSFAYLDAGELVYPAIVRKQSKGHGIAKQVEAEFLPQEVEEVLLVDDTLTTGSSSLAAAAAFRSAGFRVRYCISIIDRQEGAKEALAKEGISLASLLQAKDFR